MQKLDLAQKRILIQKIHTLPTLPNILQKIIELADSPTANAAELGKVLAQDQSITSTILKLVNSAFYGNLRHVSSINHATVILGFQMVKTIAMGVSIFQTRTETSGPSFDREGFWVHSIGVATISRILAARLSGKSLDRDTVFLAGLLHDIGKVVFDNYFSDEYKQVAEIVASEGIWIGEAEKRVLSMTHCDAGFYLARKWQFPPAVVEAIRFHHDLSKCSEANRPLCVIVHCADYCCRKMGLGSGGDDTIPELDPCMEDCGITMTLLESVLEEAEGEREKLESFISG